MPRSLFQSDYTQDGAAMAARLALPSRAGHFDELRDADGALRDAWRGFFNVLGRDGFADLDRRLEVVARQIRENGITYTVYADEGPARPWSLDLLPFIVDDAEWREIEAGVAQRAALFEAILDDVYGAQHLVAEGFLPAALVHGHPGYLRALHGVAVPGGVRLHIVAFDLARAPDGAWRVVSQRTQAPSGLGYALENRLTISRVFPDAFRELRVQHLASSYRRLLDLLEALVLSESARMFDAPDAARSGASTPDSTARIVLLTPGPYNETYFEHAYLARYLGVPLVEGSDLTVRDERVFLKTMHGLVRVHGILRRLDDDFCDPLELRSDSTIGVPGLVQAIRARRVLVANALGAGFLESPAINGFLPAISRRLLGTELELVSLASWWCGEAAARDQALADLARRVVKPTYPGTPTRPSFEPLIGASSSHAQRAAWNKRIVSDPDAYTVQAHLPLSQAPTWTGGRIVSRAVMMRVFAIADSDASQRKFWRVLPGGLTRIASLDQEIVSMQRGGSSLDTWVRTSGLVDAFSMLPAQLQPDEVIATRRRPVSSRAAENLFWMGRYTERAEYGVRLIRLAINRLSVDDDSPAAFFDTVRTLCTSAGLVGREVPSPAVASRVFERALIAALPACGESRGVGFALDALARAAGQIRDRLSVEHWRLILSAGEDFAARLGPSNHEASVSSARALEALEHLGTQLYAVTGAQTDRMTRDDGWRLLTIGRQIERLSAMSNALAVTLARDALQHEKSFGLLLGLFDSTITYRSLYQRRQELPALLDLLVFDEDNPRALASMLHVLRTEVARLPDTGTETARDLLALFPHEDIGADFKKIVMCDASGRYGALFALTRQFDVLARQLSSSISLRYFSHAGDLWRSIAT